LSRRRASETEGKKGLRLSRAGRSFKGRRYGQSQVAWVEIEP